jgi:hypothetical protein
MVMKPDEIKPCDVAPNKQREDSEPAVKKQKKTREGIGSVMDVVADVIDVAVDVIEAIFDN